MEDTTPQSVCIGLAIPCPSGIGRWQRWKRSQRSCAPAEKHPHRGYGSPSLDAIVPGAWQHQPRPGPRRGRNLR